MKTIAINEFKARLSEYLNKLEKTRVPLYITRHGKIVAKLVPYEKETEWEAAKQRLAGSVLAYEGETDPVGETDWELLNDPA